VAKGSGERSAARAEIFNCAMLRFKLSKPGLKGMELQDALQLLVVGLRIGALRQHTSVDGLCALTG
jgi:hypothetical protein